MRILVCSGLILGLLAGPFGLTPQASADNDRHERRVERGEHHDRDQRWQRGDRADDRWRAEHWQRVDRADDRWRAEHWRRIERRDDRWRFERHRGWRYEVRPGIWSPPYFWWRIGGDVVLRP